MTDRNILVAGVALVSLLTVCGPGDLVGQQRVPPGKIPPLWERAEACIEAYDRDCVESTVAEIVALAEGYQDYDAVIDSGIANLHYYYYVEGDNRALEAVIERTDRLLDRYAGQFSSASAERRLRNDNRIYEGLLAGRLGDVARRRDINESLLESTRALPERDVGAEINYLYRLAPDYIELGDYELAVAYAEAARRLLRDNPTADPGTDDPEDILDLYVANAYEKNRQYAEAADYFDRAIGSILARGGLTDWRYGRLSAAYRGRARVARLQKRFPAARRFLERDLELRRTRGASEEETWYELGKLERTAGRYEVARRELARVIDANEEDGLVNVDLANAYSETGKTYLDEGRAREALPHFQAALESLDPSFDGGTPCDNPADIGAIPANRELLPLLRAKSRAQALAANGDQQQLNCALTTLQLAIATLNDLKSGVESRAVRSRLIADNYGLFEEGVDLARSLGRNDLAFELAEQSRSNRLLSAVLASRIEGDLLPEDEARRERDLRLQLERARKQLRRTSAEADTAAARLATDTRLELERFYRSLKSDFPEYYSLLQETEPDALAAVQGNIGSDEVILSYFVGEDRSYGYLLRPGVPILVFPINAGRDRLEVLTTELLRSIYYGRNVHPVETDYRRGRTPRSREEADALFADRAHGLYELLLAPAVGEFGDEQPCLLILPHAVLNYLPFDVLLRAPVPEAEIGLYGNRSYRYVARDYRTSYAYSATLHRLMREAELPDQQEGCLVFHDPLDFAGQPGSVTAAFAAAGGDFVEVLDRQGSVDALAARGRDHQIVHFSVHGVVNGDDPADSYLQLRQNVDKGEADSLLSLSRLYLMDLPVELVFTSACNAGVGQLYDGEGVLSLARGFAHAGAKSLVTTLWAIDGGPSELLMKDFYTGLADGERKDDALFAAKRAMLGRTDYSHPYYWAGFIPIGDMRALEGTEGRPPWLLAGGVLALIGIGVWWRYRR